MNLLPDTHALIWFLEEDPRLSRKARASISNLENKSYVSDASAWEAGIKDSLGKLKLPVAYEDLFPGRLKTLGFHIQPICHAHLHRLVRLPWHHRDPFDRLLIAQALVKGLTIVTVDDSFPAYKVALLW